MNRIQEILDALEELKNGTGVPLNIRKNAEEISAILANSEDSIEAKKNKANYLLENMTDDSNIDLHIRTILYNLSSWIESLNTDNTNAQLQTFINKRLTKE